MGISTNSKSLGVLQIVAISKLHQMGKLPQGPLFDNVLQKILPELKHKISKANHMLLSKNGQSDSFLN